MIIPKQWSPGSIMPAYPWLAEDDLDVSYLEKKIAVMRQLGVPYEEGYEAQALADLEEQANEIAARIVRDLAAQGSDATVESIANKEIIALIAYLQRLGTDIKNVPAEEVVSADNTNE
jgi:cytochrome c oxidase cbb3-type subunit I/II